jgi:tRNA (guanine37-N1)-methyltransferase
VLYGAFAEGKLVGFIGIHSEGSAGLLYVDNAYRGQGIGRSLEAYLMNRHLEKGWVPYGHVTTQNADSVGLQESMGLYRADKKLWWLAR